MYFHVSRYLIWNSYKWSTVDNFWTRLIQKIPFSRKPEHFKIKSALKIKSIPVSISEKTSFRKISKPRDWYFKLSNRFAIWQAHRQHCCRSACQISERSDNSKYKSCGFETLRKDVFSDIETGPRTDGSSYFYKFTFLIDLLLTTADHELILWMGQ